MSAVVDFLKTVWKIIHDFFWPPPDPADIAYDQALETYSKYQESHNLEDLISTLEIYKTALRLRRSNKDQTELASLLVNYAVAIWSRYKDEPGSNLETRKGYLKNVIDFDEEARRLWKATPPERNLYPTLLTNLSNAYFELFRLDPPQGIEGLVQTLALSREVFDNLSYPESDRYHAAFRIGEALWARYELKAKQPEIQFADENDEKKGEKAGAQIDTLDEAIAKFKESLAYAETHDDSQTRMACYYFMAKAYNTRYTISKKTSNLDTAIDYNRKAREILDEDDPRLQTCLYDLCRELLWKYDSEKVKNRALLQDAKDIAKGKFDDILEIVDNRERRKATLPRG